MYFTTGTRESGEMYVMLRDDAPDWVRDAVRDAHCGEMPNDWRYAQCEALWASLDEGLDAEEAAEGCVSVYTADLLAWVADHLDRASLCDAVIDDDLWDKSLGLVGIIMAAQSVALGEMAHILAEAIAEHADEVTS